jgi:hypothetical protein
MLTKHFRSELFDDSTHVVPAINKIKFRLLNRTMTIAVISDHAYRAISKNGVKQQKKIMTCTIDVIFILIMGKKTKNTTLIINQI